MRPVHKSPVAQPAVCDDGVLQINHLAYSAALPPSDLCMFINLKPHLRRTRFAANEPLKPVVEAWFEGQD